MPKILNKISRKNIKIFFENPWVITIIGGVIVAIIIIFIAQPYFSDSQTKDQILNQWITAQKYENSTEYEKAIETYDQLLNTVPKKKFPYEYARTQTQIGKNYLSLSKNDNQEQNLQYAIESLNEALTVYDLKRYPNEFATTHLDLGLAYQSLSDIRDSKNNLNKSIDSFNLALLVYDGDHFPSQYAQIESYLSISYKHLGKIENTNLNFKKSFDSYKNALKYVTIENNPKE